MDITFVDREAANIKQYKAKIELDYPEITLIRNALYYYINSQKENPFARNLIDEYTKLHEEWKVLHQITGFGGIKETESGADETREYL